MQAKPIFTDLDRSCADYGSAVLEITNDTGARLGAIEIDANRAFRATVAAEREVVALIDNAHTSGANFVEYAVMRNCLADELRERVAIGKCTYRAE